MNETLGAKLESVSSLSDVIKMLKLSINKNLHVASVALFKNIVKPYDSSSGYGIVRIAPIPCEDGRGNYTTEAYILSNISFEENEIILVVYTDMDFIGNLNANRFGQSENTNPKYHSQINAVVCVTKSENGGSGYNIGGIGYTLTVSPDFSQSNFKFLILGMYNNYYGWHKYECQQNGSTTTIIVDGNTIVNEGESIDIIFTNSSTFVLLLSDYNTSYRYDSPTQIKLYDGTNYTINGTTNNNKLGYLIGDVIISTEE